MSTAKGAPLQIKIRSKTFSSRLLSHFISGNLTNKYDTSLHFVLYACPVIFHSMGNSYAYMFPWPLSGDVEFAV